MGDYVLKRWDCLVSSTAETHHIVAVGDVARELGRPRLMRAATSSTADKGLLVSPHSIVLELLVFTAAICGSALSANWVLLLYTAAIIK